MRSALIASIVAAVTLVAGCDTFADREAQTTSIADAMRVVPGVVSVDNHYVNSIDRGAEFILRVTVKQTVSGEELKRAARSFVSKVDATGFEDYIVALEFAGADNKSSLALHLSDGGRPWKIALSADAVAATTLLWVQLMQSPGVSAAVITAPAQNSKDAQSKDLVVYVADGSAGGALERGFPEVAGRWRVGGR